MPNCCACLTSPGCGDLFEHNAAICPRSASHLLAHQQEAPVTTTLRPPCSTYMWRPAAGAGVLPEAVPLWELQLAPWAGPEQALEAQEAELEEGSECAG